MQIIYSKTEKITSRATSVVASSENPSYPASNLILGDVSKMWRSVSATPPIATQTLTIAVPSGINSAFGIFGCNATSIAYAIKNTSESTTYFSGTLDPTPSSPDRTYNRDWFSWTSNGYALHIILTLTAPTTATYHTVGEIVVGSTVLLPDPKYGMGQERMNNQVIQKLSSGGRYVHPGSIPRIFSPTWLMNREIEFDDLDEIYANVGENPLAMLLSENTNNNPKWCGYFHMASKPKASHDHPSYSIVSLSLEEAV